MAAPVVVVLFLVTVLAVCITAYMNVDELDAISYHVDILSSPVIGGQESESMMQMKSRYGQEYQCSLPEVPRLYFDESNRRGSGDTSGDPADLSLLLKPLETSPCLTKTKDWWTYEFCYGKHIKQYHLEDNKIVTPVIVLGLYESEYNWQNEAKAEGNSRNRLQRYHSQYYVNGSTCDVTGNQRRSEVRFVCEDGSGDYIHHVDEPESCRYIVTIHTTKVCHHPYLRPPPNNEAQSIVCNPVLTSDQYEKYLKREEEKKAAIEEKRQVWLAKQEEQLLALKRLKEKEEEREKKLLQDEVAIREKIKETLSVINKVIGEEDPAAKDLFVGKETLAEHDSSAKASEQATATNPVEPLTTRTFIEGVKELEKMNEKWQLLREDIQEKMREVEQQMKQQTDKDGQIKSENSMKRIILERLSAILKQLLQQVDKVETDMQEASNDLVNVHNYMNTVSNSQKYGEVVTQKTEMQMEPGSEEKDEDFDSQTSSSSATKSTEKYRKFAEILKSLREKRTDSSAADSEEDDTMGEIEKALVAKLRESGIDTQGRKFEVKIITSGYFDEDAEYETMDEDGEEGGEYQTVLIKLMGDDDEAAQNLQHQNRLEKNYRFFWDEESTTDSDSDHDSKDKDN